MKIKIFSLKRYNPVGILFECLENTFKSSLEFWSFHGDQWSFLFKVSSATMVSDIMRSLFVTLTFFPEVYDYRYYCRDSSQCIFFKCNFSIRSSFKKKTHNCSNSVKSNRFSKYQFNILRVKRTFCISNEF